MTRQLALAKFLKYFDEAGMPLTIGQIKEVKTALKWSGEEEFNEETYIEKIINIVEFYNDFGEIQEELKNTYK